MQSTSRPTPPIGGVSSTVPERVMQDMAFLKESWANMVEAEEEATTEANETEQREDNFDDGFQVHLSKNQKKAQKKLKCTSKDSYATRSKVAPKPFK
jgi:coenzyme F420-reducing hydrogenase alpha subunit